MNRFILPVLIVTGYGLLQSCAVQNHANTIERDKDNPCIVHIVVQVGVDGNDSDVIAVREQLEPCFSKECFIPCGNDSTKGCKVTTNAIVKKWSSLSNKEQSSFHHVTMVPDDKKPSNAQIGTANGGSSVGEWRRNAYPRTYCHETLHLLGLPDQYCSRLFNAVDSSIINEIACVPPPDPNGGSCCSPTPQHTRCSSPCTGHENDLMATLTPDLSCQNILDVLKAAGMDKCPDECCNSHHTYYRNEFFIAPSYLHFGDKDYHIGAYGGSLGYTYKVSPKLGLTIDLGYYGKTQTDSLSDEKTKYSIYTFGLGLNYYPNLFGSNSKLGLSTHAYMGIMKLKSEFELGGSTYSTDKSSFCPNLGAALNYNLNAKWEIRLIQADYMPTFFFSGTQNNYRLSVGLGLRW